MFKQLPCLGVYTNSNLSHKALASSGSKVHKMQNPIAVIVIFVIIQYLESNVIFPKVVGSHLKLSTWATLVASIAATIIWGLAGMVLVTPFLSILKIITDYVPQWKPLNVLLNRVEGHP
jgi:predicted PurR-regulated permease PerM